MKKWLKWLIPGEELEADSIEKKVEKILPQKVKREVRSHYLLYILGSLLILVLVGYFAISYAKDAKETKKNQDLIQQQIDLQKKQLDLQAKQIEDAKKTTTTTPPATIPAVTTPKATTPTCNKTKQQDQENVLIVEIAKIKTAISTNESLIREREAYLLKPEIYQGSHNDEQKGIDTLNGYNTSNNANLMQRQSNLDDVKKCSLFTDNSANMLRTGCLDCMTGIAPYRP